jgi:hypothetical protein
MYGTGLKMTTTCDEETEYVVVNKFYYMLAGECFSS